jgi:hypothetical protein
MTSNGERMIKVYAKQDCGCCTVEMRFNSMSAARRAFARLGLGNGMEIKDDAGVLHTNIDTFYGCSANKNEQGDKSLLDLVEQVSDSGKGQQP